MVTVNAFGVILFDMAFVVELNLRKPVTCFFKWNDVPYFLVIRFYANMTLLAFYRTCFSFMAVFAEIVEDNHF